MPFIAATLMFAQAALDPELEAVIGRRKPPAERRTRDRGTDRPPATAAPTLDPELEACVASARTDPARARLRAEQWVARSDSPSARQCLGVAAAQEHDWQAAVDAFGAGARLAGSDEGTAARLWSQAGNAALAGQNFPAAKSALDKALALPMSNDVAHGEALLDRARANVALKDDAGARVDLDAALQLVPQDPLAWLLSATLARRMDDLPHARAQIVEAARLAPDDASVALEQGVIAALSGDDVSARTAFRHCAALAPDQPIAAQANAYLAQLDATALPAAPDAKSR